MVSSTAWSPAIEAIEQSTIGGDGKTSAKGGGIRLQPAESLGKSLNRYNRQSRVGIRAMFEQGMAHK
jgi:hypothetical protein